MRNVAAFALGLGLICLICGVGWWGFLHPAVIEGLAILCTAVLVGLIAYVVGSSILELIDLLKEGEHA